MLVSTVFAPNAVLPRQSWSMTAFGFAALKTDFNCDKFHSGGKLSKHSTPLKPLQRHNPTCLPSTNQPLNHPSSKLCWESLPGLFGEITWQKMSPCNIRVVWALEHVELSSNITEQEPQRSWLDDWTCAVPSLEAETVGRVVWRGTCCFELSGLVE